MGRTLQNKCPPGGAGRKRGGGGGGGGGAFFFLLRVRVFIFAAGVGATRARSLAYQGGP